MLFSSFAALAVIATSSLVNAQISVGSFTTRAHQVAGEVFVLSERVLEIRDFVYDGTGPAAFFWADKNPRPSDDGRILYDGSPAMSCGGERLPQASQEVYRVEFPEGSSVLDYLGGSISVWCEAFSANFGELVLPETLEGVPPTEDGPALQCSDSPTPSPGEGVPDIAKTPPGFNCEPLNENFQVRWAVEDDQLAVELVGLVDETTYMSFGPSGSSESTFMVGADVVVCDTFEGEFRARDFYMNSRAQCSNGDGVCPDTVSNFADDVSDVSGERDFGITLVRYKKPLVPTNAEDQVSGVDVDRPISVQPGETTFIAWALGPVSTDTGLPNFHSIGFPREDVSIEFGRDVTDNCEPLVRDDTPDQPTPAPETPTPFQRPILANITEFKARIGPSGGPKGYEAITGRTAWGIAWYINDYLIPVIELRRGKTYTFRVNGGDDAESPSEYHPMYLTTSISGGYSQLTEEERMDQEIFGGLEIIDGDVNNYNATATGPLCMYEVGDETTEASDGTFEEYFSTLDTSCASNVAITDAAGVLTFTPDENTPDLLYYQCVTHRNLGWKIHVLDAGDPPLTQPPTPSPVTQAPASSPTDENEMKVPASAAGATGIKPVTTIASLVAAVAYLML